MESWLVQNGKFKHREKEGITGIDSLIQFNYMGSAEFEFGALPQSLNRMIAEWTEYAVFPTPLKNKKGHKLHLLCRKDKSTEAIKCAVDVAKRAYRLKEYAGLNDYLNGDEKHSDFWWDIENDWMLCAGESDMDLLKSSIEKVIEKRKG